MGQLPDEITLRNLSNDELLRWIGSSDSPVVRELCLRLETEINCCKELSQHSNPGEPVTRRFKDLPKGTRFKYPGTNGG